MFCIGLTGNMGVGKSTVRAIFESFQIPTIDADHIAKSLTQPGEAALFAIQAHFGDDLIQEGQLNRQALRERIFKAPKEKKWLEELLHPLIRKAILEKLQDLEGPYCIIEIPLLLKLSDYPYLQRILLVLSPLDEQLRRIEKRDRTPPANILSILEKQPSVAERKALADDILCNDGTLDKLKAEVGLLHKKYLSLSLCSKN